MTAVALCDQQTGWLAGHVVDSKGSSTQQTVDHFLWDLRRMGHHGKIVVKTDQESASKIPIASAMISSTPKPAKHSSSPKLAGAPEEGQDPRSLVNNSIEMPSERARGKQ